VEEAAPEPVVTEPAFRLLGQAVDQHQRLPAGVGVDLEAGQPISPLSHHESVSWRRGTEGDVVDRSAGSARDAAAERWTLLVGLPSVGIAKHGAADESPRPGTRTWLPCEARTLSCPSRHASPDLLFADKLG